MTMEIIFDNGAKRENQIAGAFLKFYLPTILQIDKDVLDAQDAEKLVSTGSKPDYYIPSIGMLLEISTLVDKKFKEESAGLYHVQERLKQAILGSDLSGLCGYWDMDFPFSFRCRRHELKKVASAIVDGIRRECASVTDYPVIKLNKVSDGPFDFALSGRASVAGWSL